MVSIRRFEPRDAPAVAELITVTMKRSNAQDYPRELLQALIDYFTPSKIAHLALERYCLVAEDPHCIIGTAAIEESHIRTFFVHPEHQGNGIGSSLLAEIEAAAAAAGLTSLTVEASLTGAAFYGRRGFTATGKTIPGVAGPQIEMEKRWDDAKEGGQ